MRRRAWLAAASCAVVSPTFTHADGLAAAEVQHLLLPERIPGAVGDGFTDDTEAIQRVLDRVRLAGGGAVYLPPGTYAISRSLRIGSRTRLHGAGAASIIKARQGGYAGTNGGSYATQNCQLIQNYNFAANTLTDTSILIEDLAFDWGRVTIAGGGAHSISLRMVDRVRIRGCSSTGGENVTALVACRDTLTEACDGLNVSNCFFDHWDGALSARVVNCVGRVTSGTIAQGIQFTGTGSNDEARSSTDALVMGCSLYGVRRQGSSAAIIANANQAASSVYRLRSIGNYVEDSDIGLCFQGAGGQHLSMGDAFHKVSSAPIFLHGDASGHPANCRVIDPHLVDCTHLPENIALISVAGSGHQVKGVKVTNTGAVRYRLIAYLASSAVDCHVEIDSAASGLAGRVSNRGTRCTVMDREASASIAR